MTAALAAVLLAAVGVTATSTPPVARTSAPRRAPVTVNDLILGYTFVLGYAELTAPTQPVHIQAGDTVTWTNLDNASHDVTSDDAFCGVDGCKPFTAYLAGTKAVSFTFAKPGYYRYHCNQHPQFPGMFGLVFVDPSAVRPGRAPGSRGRAPRAE